MRKRRFSLTLLISLLLAVPAAARPSAFSFTSGFVYTGCIMLVMLLLLALVLVLKFTVSDLRTAYKKQQQKDKSEDLKRHIAQLSSTQIEKINRSRHRNSVSDSYRILPAIVITALFLLFSVTHVSAQSPVTPSGESLLQQSGIIITLILILLPILVALLLLVIRTQHAVRRQRNIQKTQEAGQLAGYLSRISDQEMNLLLKKKKELDYSLSHQELSGREAAEDSKGLLRVNQEPGLPIVALKKKALPRPQIDPALAKLVLWYLGCATFWLLFGTTIGEYVGIKFVAPDADHISWLSMGRLRPVHTNAVFWGWASLGMLGLGYYIVPRVSNTALASLKMGWYALLLINIAVVAGTICLMAGINNAGGEYREYIWPVMLLFGAGLALSLINFLKTVARRKTTEIYISNWYMISAIIFTIVIALAAYIPYWQNGLGETIVQGYYMHQGVGMWFMLFTLGIVYYFLPQQLNKPIYSYSLGVLAFWTQILFYTLIGTHHFVFSAIPWWLQTVAIVGSAGMVIPVIAGTTNFLLTFKGAWHKVRDSYTLPFFLVGIVFYFTGSLQGTAEAFRFTNLVWHFTDFTVAHSHLTMYGIICFFLWACIYAVIPRLTGREAPQLTIGIHFWLALAGLLFYSVPLMYGGTLKGLLWMQGKPFIDGVTLMEPYWLWRAIGGSLMWLSHLFFAYNIYRMIVQRPAADVREAAIQQLEEKAILTTQPGI